MSRREPGAQGKPLTQVQSQGISVSTTSQISCEPFLLRPPRSERLEAAVSAPSFEIASQHSNDGFKTICVVPRASGRHAHAGGRPLYCKAIGAGQCLCRAPVFVVEAECTERHRTTDATSRPLCMRYCGVAERTFMNFPSAFLRIDSLSPAAATTEGSIWNCLTSHRTVRVPPA